MSNRFVKYEIQPTKIGQFALPVYEFIRGIDITLIPSEFIEAIDVEYNNGALIRVSGNEVNGPIVIHKKSHPNQKDELFKNVSHVTVIMDFDEFQAYMDLEIEELFHRCGVEKAI